MKSESIPWYPHSTVAAIIEENGRFLMVEEESLGEIVINQPAGHIEENETFVSACQRETLEETGHEVEVDSVIGFYATKTEKGTTYHRFCFKASVVKAHSDYKLDEGIIRARWMDLEEIKNAPNLRSPIVLQCIMDYLAGSSYPLELINDAQIGNPSD